MEERVTRRKTVTATDRPTSKEKSVSSISVAERGEETVIIFQISLEYIDVSTHTDVIEFCMPTPS